MNDKPPLREFLISRAVKGPYSFKLRVIRLETRRDDPRYIRLVIDGAGGIPVHSTGRESSVA